MVEKLFIQDWDNFSEREQNQIEELIELSLKARELRLALVSDSSAILLNEGFEVTGNMNEAEAKPLEKVIPRVASFLSKRPQATEALRLMIEKYNENCDERRRACDSQFPDDETRRNDCKKRCEQEQQTQLRVVAEIISSDSFV